MMSITEEVIELGTVVVLVTTDHVALVLRDSYTDADYGAALREMGRWPHGGLDAEAHLFLMDREVLPFIRLP